jgi:Chaperone of endosialidase
MKPAQIPLPVVAHSRWFWFLFDSEEIMARMKGSFSWVLMVGGVLSGTAMAQQPPDVVSSDTAANTAMGTGALRSLTPDLTGQTSAGVSNTASGYFALYSNTTGYGNTASGASALSFNTTGSGNTAFGAGALVLNTTGFANTACGNGALFSNTTGNANTASGEGALTFNTTGGGNTVSGYWALYSNTTGNYNTASGYDALYLNTTGSNNEAFGSNALYSNTAGVNNTAFGFQTLYSNTTGNGNAAQGANSLSNNTTGIENVGIGDSTLYLNSTGSYNIGIGFGAGYNQTTGSGNIYIANMGVAGESQTLRLGSQGSEEVLGSGITRAYIAGVASSHITGAAVYITRTGRLGVLASSERYKTDVQDLGSEEGRLQRLRPVSFHLKTDPAGPVQYGLIAEEVEQVYPELVIRDADGQIQGVRYEELAPMVLNEVQRQQKKVAAQEERIAAQQELIAAQAQQLGELPRLVQRLAIQERAIQDLQQQLAQVRQLKEQVAAIK